jgi:hypothetical protein
MHETDEKMNIVEHEFIAKHDGAYHHDVYRFQVGAFQFSSPSGANHNKFIDIQHDHSVQYTILQVLYIWVSGNWA